VNARSHPPVVATVLDRIAVETGGAALPPLAAADAAALAAACGPDAGRLKRWIKRRLAGEPLAYILGTVNFRGRQFRLDKRAFITDPETSLLVDAVCARIDRFTARHGRAPLVAEVGCGNGCLGLSVKLERPAVTLVGLELDADALAVAKLNAAEHAVDVHLVESDLFDAWPLPTAPDLIFADPPWGSAETLYDPARDAAHYHAMPAASAFPLGGITGAHAQILRAVAGRRWSSEIWLNAGVLPPAAVATVARDVQADECEIIQPTPELSLLRCRLFAARELAERK
jgi:SAM-dependent methyltransferase